MITIRSLLLELSKVPEDQLEARMKSLILAYDKMCHLDCIKAPLNKLWKTIKKIVDRLHLQNHKDARCKVTYDPSTIPESYNTMIAEQTFSWFSRDRQPEWYNSEIIYARNMRDKYNALGLWSEYKFWRNKTKQIVDNSKKNYYKNMVKDSNDPKTLWKCLHSLNPKVKNTPYELATEDNNTTKSKKCIADTFNNFFTSCAEKLREQGSYTPVNKADFSNLSKFVKNKLHKT
ncbi:unnamed protein product [Mytilus edulis]|uniref:Uncharacterized protein n=1 Tax=Mytilus edulis TaxID=6550 RepID=A0A8S3R226_MYTED|nr:unnamed protein product [Mytilus edulis]